MSNVTEPLPVDPSAEPAVDAELEMVKGNMDAFFLIINGFIIFFMQGGFAFLEAGSVRSVIKSTFA